MVVMDFTLNAFTIIVTIVSILIGLSVHEAMHAYTGLKLGDDTAAEAGRVSFNPLRHIDPLTTILLPIVTLITFGAPILAAKPVPFNPARVKYEEFGAAMIAFAGPFSNLILAVIGAVASRLFVGEPDIYNILTIFVAINVSLFIFNLIPIPPLDGSRVLYAFSPEPLQNFLASIENFGFFIVFGLILFFPPFSQAVFGVITDVILFLL